MEFVEHAGKATGPLGRFHQLGRIVWRRQPLSLPNGARLVDLQTQINTLHDQMIATILDASSVDSQWYAQLAQSYGQTVYVPEGVYDAINQSAQTEQQNANYYTTSSTALNSQMSALISDLASCVRSAR